MNSVTAAVRPHVRVRQRAGRRSGLVEVIVATCLAGSLAACATAPVTGSNTAAVDPELGVAPSPRLTPSPKTSRSGSAVATRKSVAPSNSVARAIAPGGGYQKVGKPYKIAGKLYVPQRDPNYDRVGVASWYGKQFHGRLTANGERFDMNSLSAAHPTMPLPAYARVTNVANGRSIIVRVNDRGPFAHDRVIDLSKKTAAVLDFKHKGTAKVRVQFVGDAPLHGKDEKFLVASYKGPGPGPEPSGSQSAPVVTAYSAPPAARPQAVFPEGLASGELDRAVVESGTPFDPSSASGRTTDAAATPKDGDPVKNSYTADHRVSLAFTAIEDLIR